MLTDFVQRDKRILEKRKNAGFSSENGIFDEICEIIADLTHNI